MDRVSFSVFASLSFVPAISHSVFFFAFAFIAGFFFHVKKARSKAIEFTDSNFNHVRERRTDLFSLLRILFLPLRNWRFFKRSLFSLVFCDLRIFSVYTDGGHVVSFFFSLQPINNNDYWLRNDYCKQLFFHNQIFTDIINITSCFFLFEFFLFFSAFFQ